MEPDEFMHACGASKGEIALAHERATELTEVAIRDLVVSLKRPMGVDVTAKVHQASMQTAAVHWFHSSDEAMANHMDLYLAFDSERNLYLEALNAATGN